VPTLNSSGNSGSGGSSSNGASPNEVVSEEDELDFDRWQVRLSRGLSWGRAVPRPMDCR
jgi:hypothetical protein